jgi:hypothetical protein
MTKEPPKKDLTPREKRIEELRTELGCTRAHAASIVHAEEAQKNRTEALKEAKERS